MRGLCGWCECTHERTENLERRQRIDVGFQQCMCAVLPAAANFSGEGEDVDVSGLAVFGSVDDLDFVYSQCGVEPGVGFLVTFGHDYAGFPRTPCHAVEI